MSRAQSLVTVVGMALVVSGVAMLSVPAALIVAGAALVADVIYGRRDPR